MFRRTAVRRVSLKDFLGLQINPISGFFGKELFLGGFIASMTYLCVFSIQEVQKAGPTELPPELLAERRRKTDPRRPPWPLLHQRAVMMREGKASHDDLALLWEQTKHYYPHDWLIPLELSQVLKYVTGAYLQNYVPDPELFKQEIMQQLENIADGTVKDPSGTRINREIIEIITMVIYELKVLDMGTGITLVPRHTM